MRALLASYILIVCNNACIIELVAVAKYCHAQMAIEIFCLNFCKVIMNIFSLQVEISN